MSTKTEHAMISVHGLSCANVTEHELVNHIIECCSSGQGGWVVTANVDILRQYARDPNARQLVDGADIVVADGMPLIWASRLRGTPLKERVCGSNLITSLPAAAAEHSLSVFLLGGAADSAARAADILSHRHPQLRIAGTVSPPVGFEHEPQDLERLKQSIVAGQPDIVFVALGFPKQERLIRELRNLQPNAWWLGVGISFSFLCGDVSRAPKWMQRSGLEWVHRLVMEPRRLIKRYLVHDVPFAVSMYVRAFVDRIRP